MIYDPYIIDKRINETIYVISTPDRSVPHKHVTEDEFGIDPSE